MILTTSLFTGQFICALDACTLQTANCIIFNAFISKFEHTRSHIWGTYTSIKEDEFNFRRVN